MVPSLVTGDVGISFLPFPMPDKNPAKTTGRSKAGQKGGKTTASRYGPDFYAAIGRKGGKARRRPRSTAA